MRYGFLTVVTLLVASAPWAWSKEPESSLPRMSLESTELPSDAPEARSNAMRVSANEPAPTQVGESQKRPKKMRTANSAAILPVKAGQEQGSQLAAWFQNPEASDPVLIQPVAEFQPLPPETQSEPLPVAGTGPTLAGDSYYLNDAGYANSNNAAPGYTDNNAYGGGGSYYGGNGGRVWGSAEVLLWWIKQGSTPPLVTCGALPSTGAIGPGTSHLDRVCDTSTTKMFTSKVTSSHPFSSIHFVA